MDNLPKSKGATEEFQVRLEKEFINLPERKVQLLNTSPEESKPANPASPKQSQRTSQPFLPRFLSSPSWRR